MWRRTPDCDWCDRSRRRARLRSARAAGMEAPSGVRCWITIARCSRARRTIGAVHFAGSEAATNWCGSMSGANQSGLHFRRSSAGRARSRRLTLSSEHRRLRFARRVFAQHRIQQGLAIEGRNVVEPTHRHPVDENLRHRTPPGSFDQPVPLGIIVRDVHLGDERPLLLQKRRSTTPPFNPVDHNCSHGLVLTPQRSQPPARLVLVSANALRDTRSNCFKVSGRKEVTAGGARVIAQLRV